MAIDRNPASAGIRFGVNAKLQIAFGLVAVLTVIAAAVAIMSFSATERGVARVAGYDVPMMTDALGCRPSRARSRQRRRAW